MMFDFGSVSWRILAFDDDSNMVASELETLPLLLDTATSLESFPDRLDREARSDRAEFLLVTFEFDRADLTEQGRAELKQILSRIGSGSRVTITGYTDRTGEAKRNRKLARKRAEVVGRLIPDGIPTTIRGAEPHEAPYSSSTPEGRFLSRTVRVVIENPK